MSENAAKPLMSAVNRSSGNNMRSNRLSKLESLKTVDDPAKVPAP